jgi:hypothetical protein
VLQGTQIPVRIWSGCGVLLLDCLNLFYFESFVVKLDQLFLHTCCALVQYIPCPGKLLWVMLRKSSWSEDIVRSCNGSSKPSLQVNSTFVFGKSYGVVGPGWGRWPWLIHGPNGYDCPLLTIHSICITNTEKVGTCSCGCFKSNWFSCMRTRHLGGRFLRFTHFPRKGVKLMMVLGCAGSYVKLALPQLQ